MVIRINTLENIFNIMFAESLREKSFRYRSMRRFPFKKENALCNKIDLGDGFHYLLVCTQFTNERTELLKPYN